MIYVTRPFPGRACETAPVRWRGIGPGSAVVGCLALASLSWLIWPSATGYDPLSWAVWGREVAHGRLSIAPGDATFKPLPVAVDALLTVLHAPVLATWAVLMRAAGIGALLVAFLVGRRAAGTAAGICAAALLLAIPWFVLPSTAQATAEPLEVLTLLAAVGYAVRRRPVPALWCLAVLGLLRPEGWFLVVLTAAWLVWERRRAVGWVAPLVLVTVASWFVAEYAGSGHWGTGVAKAGTPTMGGPLLSRRPWLAVVAETYHTLPWWVWPIAAAGLVAVAVPLARRRVAPARVALPLLLAGIAVAWLVVVAAMVQLRLSAGDARYLAGTTVPVAMLAALIIGTMADRVTRSLGTRAVAVAIVLLVVLSGGGYALGRVRQTRPLLAATYAQQAQLSQALTSTAVSRCARVATGPFRVPLLAWYLRRPLPAIGVIPAPGSVWVVPPEVRDPLPQDVEYRSRYWRVARVCAAAVAARR